MLVFTLLWSLFTAVALASFGYVDNGNYYTIDSGSKLVIEVSKTNGNIQSMKYDVCTTLSPCRDMSVYNQRCRVGHSTIRVVYMLITM